MPLKLIVVEDDAASFVTVNDSSRNSIRDLFDMV
jgi:hypothetical protein